MDTQMLQDHIAGLQAKLNELRGHAALFHKAQGLHEEAARAKRELVELETDLQAVKETLSELKSQRANAMATTTHALTERMNAALPYGEAVFDISDDGVFIGWRDPQTGITAPYNALSGGFRAAFDQALSYALLGNGGHKVLICEAAELDDAHLISTMHQLEKLPSDTQVIISTCHTPSETPLGWNVVEVGHAA